jgi:Ca-activated chloride channel family protein
MDGASCGFLHCLRAPALRFSLIACALFAGLPQSSSMPPQQAGKIRVQTTLVHVPVMVSDSRGGPVVGLTAEDFGLYDDGVRQPLAFFATSSEPIRIALLLDTSKSTATVLDRIRKAAAGFLDQLRPQDQAMLAVFDSDIRILCSFGTDLPELKAAVRGVQVGGDAGTHMRDAVVRIAGKHLRNGQGRKAIILLTDGQDNGSSASRDEMIDAVLGSGVVVYPIYYTVDMRELVKKLFGVSLSRNRAGASVWKREEEEAAALLQRLADESAGTLLRSDTTDFKRTFQRVADELRHQYLVAFYPDPSRLDGMLHTLTVNLARPSLIVRSRRSYRASGPLPE